MGSVSVRLLHVIVAGAAERGVEPQALIRAAGLAVETLADPDGRVSHRQEHRLWSEAIRLTGDDAFGLQLAERLTPHDLGALGYAMRSSATLGDAYQRLCRYLAVLADGPVLDVQIRGREAIVRHTHEPQPPRDAVELLMAGVVSMARRNADPAFLPRAASFRHAPPEQLDVRRRWFGSNVTFNAPHNELSLDAALLAHPQAAAEPALSAILDIHLSSLAASIPKDESFLDRVRAALARDLTRGEPTLSSIADRLKMSPRSLQRRLQDEGTSLKDVLATQREALAIHHLADASCSIAEVAFLLGFSEVSTFHRAFKRWTGVTPAAYRRGGYAS